MSLLIALFCSGNQTKRQMAAAASAAAASGATSPKLEELEQTLISIKECFVYPAGPRKSSAGYQAKDWDLDKPAFTCEIKARSTDSAMTIQFWKDGTLMCTSVAIPLATVKKDKPLTAYLEPVSDSSRYFVVRAQTPEKRTIMIGFGFRNRSEAFDLTAALNDRISRVQRMNELETSTAAANAAAKANGTANEAGLAPLPFVDYSLKDDIEISFKTKKNNDNNAQKEGDDQPSAASSSASSASVSTGGGPGAPAAAATAAKKPPAKLSLFALAPPPKDSAASSNSANNTNTAAASTAAASATANKTGLSGSMAGLSLNDFFTPSPSATASATASSAAKPAAAIADDDWGQFESFSSGNSK